MFELCMAILQLIAKKGSIQHVKMISAFTMGTNLLNDSLEILVDQNLITEEKCSSNLLIYSITTGGNNVLKFFNLDLAQKDFPVLADIFKL